MVPKSADFRWSFRMVQDRYLGSDVDAVEMLPWDILPGTNCLTLSRFEFYIEVVNVVDGCTFRVLDGLSGCVQGC